MRNIMLLITLIFGMLSCTQGSYTNYDSPKGYSFLFEGNDWEVRENQNQTFLFNKQNLKEKSAFNTNLNIIVQDLSKTPVNLDEYHTNTLKQVEQVLGKNAIKSEKEIKISGNKGKEIIYVMPKDISSQRMEALKLKQVYFIEKDKAYLITYTSKIDEFDKYLSSAEKMFETFTFK
jgi:hypothetical protein